MRGGINVKKYNVDLIRHSYFNTKKAPRLGEAE